MGKALRTGAALLVVVLAMAGVWWEAGRWRLLADEAAVDRTLVAAMNASSPMIRSRIAHNVLLLLKNRSRYPLDVNLRMEAAAAFRIVGDFEGAEREYLAALRITDRPEVHVALGDLYMKMERVDPALDHYAYAVAFAPSNIRFIRAHRNEVLSRAEQWTRRAESGEDLR